MAHSPWLKVLIWTILIFISLPFIRIPAEWLRNHNLLIQTIYFAYFIFIIAISYIIVVKEKEQRIIVWISIFMILLVLLQLSKFMIVPEEKIHFLQYGILGYFLFKAILHSIINSRKIYSFNTSVIVSGFLALIFCSFIGFLDEIIQYYLPSRVYDIRDIIWNSIGGLFGILIILLIKLNQNTTQKNDCY